MTPNVREREGVQKWWQISQLLFNKKVVHLLLEIEGMTLHTLSSFIWHLLKWDVCDETQHFDHYFFHIIKWWYHHRRVMIGIIVEVNDNSGRPFIDLIKWCQAPKIATREHILEKFVAKTLPFSYIFLS